MEQVAMFAMLSVCVHLLWSFQQHGAHGARILSARVHRELPPCIMHWQVPGWDCYEPPKTPLPPGNSKHHSPIIDRSTNPPAAADITDVSHSASSVTPVAASVTQRAQYSQEWPELPPCNFTSAVPGRDCFEPPTHDLPPSDLKHQRVGIDCWPKNPPTAKATAETDISAACIASAHVQSSTNAQSGAHHIQGMLPPCKDVWGGIPGWDCFDPPTHDLPPCDFNHQRAGFDCWPRDPPAAVRP